MRPKTRPFEITQMLQTEQDIAEYLCVALEDGDSDEFVRALRHSVKARGMTEIAKTSGLTREALYKALRPGSQPRFDTILKVIHALGLRLETHAGRQPAAHASDAGHTLTIRRTLRAVSPNSRASSATLSPLKRARISWCRARGDSARFLGR